MSNFLRRVLAPWYNEAQDQQIDSRLRSSQERASQVTERAKEVAVIAETAVLNFMPNGTTVLTTN